jgi:hypothetical protein
MFKRIPLLFVCLLLFFFSELTIGQNKKEIKRTVKLEKDGKVAINTYKGEVNVSVWDQSEVEIYARIEPDDNIFSADDEWMVKNTEIIIDESSSYLKIKSDYSRINDHRRNHSFLGIFDVGESTSLPNVIYHIKIPKEARLSIKDYKSGINISRSNDIEIDTYKGNVQIDDLNGGLDLKTYKGEAKVEINKIQKNSFIDTYKGKIDVNISKENGFDLRLNLDDHVDFYSNFDVEKYSEKNHKRHKGYYFNTSINGGGPQLEIKSHKGDIQLRKI